MVVPIARGLHFYVTIMQETIYGAPQQQQTVGQCLMGRTLTFSLTGLCERVCFFLNIHSVGQTSTRYTWISKITLSNELDCYVNWWKLKAQHILYSPWHCMFSCWHGHLSWPWPFFHMTPVVGHQIHNHHHHEVHLALMEHTVCQKINF